MKIFQIIVIKRVWLLHQETEQVEKQNCLVKKFHPLTHTVSICKFVFISVCVAAAVTCLWKGDRWECAHLPFCKCTNGACVRVCVGSSAVKCYSRWPFRWRRGGITVTVWQSRPQPFCNGWALSRWTPLLPLFFSFPFSSHVSSFPLRQLASFACFWPSMRNVFLFPVIHWFISWSYPSWRAAVYVVKMTSAGLQSINKSQNVLNPNGKF